MNGMWVRQCSGPVLVAKAIKGTHVPAGPVWSSVWYGLGM
jgi:hypothetical protein